MRTEQDQRLAPVLQQTRDRAAFVTDRDVLTGIAVAFGGLVPGEFQVFPLSKRDEAIAWVAEGAQSRA